MLQVLCTHAFEYSLINIYKRCDMSAVDFGRNKEDIIFKMTWFYQALTLYTVYTMKWKKENAFFLYYFYWHNIILTH